MRSRRDAALNKRKQINAAVFREVIPERYRSKQRKDKCLKPDCWREEEQRGLCSSCNAAAWRAIQEGQATEQELIEHGKMLPKKRNARLWLLDFKAVKDAE